MRLVTAIIKPHRLDDVKAALVEAGIPAMTVTEAKGFGRQGGHTETYRGAEYKVDFLPKLRLEIVVEETQADEVTRTIADAAKTGSIGDGKIWVTPVDTVLRIRTGDLGAQAL